MLVSRRHLLLGAVAAGGSALAYAAQGRPTQAQSIAGMLTELASVLSFDEDASALRNWSRLRRELAVVFTEAVSVRAADLGVRFERRTQLIRAITKGSKPFRRVQVAISDVRVVTGRDQTHARATGRIRFTGQRHSSKVHRQSRTFMVHLVRHEGAWRIRDGELSTPTRL